MAIRPLALIVLCTCPDQQTGEMLARDAVEQKLAACVNIIPGLTSIFKWDGVIESETEVLLLAKTSRDAYGALRTSGKAGIHMNSQRSSRSLSRPDPKLIFNG